MFKNKSHNLLIAVAIAGLIAPTFTLPSKSLESDELQSQSINSNSFTGNVLKGQVVSVPAGASAAGTIDRAITSAGSRPGDRGIVTLSEGTNGIPAGSKVEYTVDRVQSAKRGFEKPGEVVLRAIKITYPNGQSATVQNAFITNKPGETVIKGATTGRRVAESAGKAAVGAGAGALAGLTGAAISGGRKGKASAIGAGIGLAGGLIGAAAGKGDDVNIGAGQKVFLMFSKATQLNVQ